MLIVPDAGDDTWPERTGRVQAATSVVYSDHFSDKQCHADTDRCHEGCFVLFVGKHVDGEDQLASQNGFNLAAVSVNPLAQATRIHTKTPRAIDVPSDNVVRTLNVVGNKTDTRKELKIAPTNCAPINRNPRTTLTPLTMTIAMVTAGLKLYAVSICPVMKLSSTHRPPEIRKKIQTLTIKLNPNDNAM